MNQLAASLLSFIALSCRIRLFAVIDRLKTFLPSQLFEIQPRYALLALIQNHGHYAKMTLDSAWDATQRQKTTSSLLLQVIARERCEIERSCQLLDQ
jgi:hypothetical protein